MSAVLRRSELILAAFLLMAVLSVAPRAYCRSMRPQTDNVPVEQAGDGTSRTSPTAANEEWQFFRINAQYRGAVKKSFHNLGCAIAWFKDLSPDQTQVIVHVCALHPEKKGQKFAFRLNLVLQRQQARYSLLNKIYSDYTGITGDRQIQLQQLAALWAYLRHFARDGLLYPSFDACGAVLKLSEVSRKKSQTLEINCSWPFRRGFTGKFFFEKIVGGPAAALDLDKLRFRSGHLSVSLVKDTQAAVTRDFAHRQPFAVDVFR